MALDPSAQSKQHYLAAWTHLATAVNAVSTLRNPDSQTETAGLASWVDLDVEGVAEDYNRQSGAGKFGATMTCTIRCVVKQRIAGSTDRLLVRSIRDAIAVILREADRITIPSTSEAMIVVGIQADRSLGIIGGLHTWEYRVLARIDATWD